MVILIDIWTRDMKREVYLFKGSIVWNMVPRELSIDHGFHLREEPLAIDQASKAWNERENASQINLGNQERKESMIFLITNEVVNLMMGVIHTKGLDWSQLRWIQQRFSKHNVKKDVVILFCNIIKHLFIKDCVENKNITLKHMAADLEITDILTQNPEPAAVPKEDIIGKPTNDNDVHITDNDAHTLEGDVTKDVNDIGNIYTDAGIGTATKTISHVMDLDDLSDNDLVAAMNPGLTKRLMTRRKGKAVVQSSPKRKVAPRSPSADFIKKKSTSTGPIKSRAVSQSVSVSPTKSWNKVIPRKRKAQAIVDSDPDVDIDAQDIPLRKKPTTSKLAASVPEVPIDNIPFHYPSNDNRWKYVYHKRLVLERELAKNVLENKEIMDLIHEAGLLKIVVHFPTCYEMLVKEFIVNLSENCADIKSKDFRKVYVRGKCVTFSSTVINNFLGRSNEAQPELEVTENKICEVIMAKQVKAWPLKEKLTASKLSIKYAMLHKIGAANWVPTNHKSTVATVLGKFIYVVGTKTKFDYGTYIFDQTMKHTRSYSVKGPIAFPSIICGIIVNQYPNILSENDVVCKRESALSFHYKLFQGTHGSDIVTTLDGTSKDNTTKSKAAVIEMLGETCKELESRKLGLEN
ncbi:uncharacterized protein LOC131618778 [Vicia villosa]|uniref:uncharacterized protein LOC131618778 n=1 Tax=Vicia villosa TaxID=3911 RepID=UPI00273CB495|nr:uncharacterized protein LOC131618778 [Vicia villosa]